ncbi:phosphatidylinositol-glycan biosynthesis class X protein [Drosophila albomicans]|uniref:Phosphatidylinositol-glycan biosynthesis class X protein n=1 Tax=Drosophila albomicans TaxID=7291 RepID=A0A6P8XFQ7_DROAB|nr:phosphatidylinositol-glycan biosynthesis class X protein [Drosophila albomicans]
MMNSTSTVLLLFSFIITLLICNICCESLQRSIVSMEMEKEGMHRNLKYNVQFADSIINVNCEYAILQSLPAAVFISTDELDDLQRLKMLNAIYPKFVDIEAITEKATPFTVLLRGKASTEETITLPIHFRYHAASDKLTAVTVEINTPQLYLNCPINDNHKPIDTELPIKTDKLHCLNRSQCNLEVHEGDSQSPEDCNWLQVTAVDYQLKEPLKAEIPVGNAKGFTPILYVTIILSWVISIWTVLDTQTVPRRIHRSVNELHQKVKVK